MKDISLVDILSKGGYVWIYPPTVNSVIEGREHLSYRVFNNNGLRKAFCKHCGVHISNEGNPLTGKLGKTLTSVILPKFITWPLLCVREERMVFLTLR